MAKVLLVGATGYLGGYIAQELKKRKYFTRLVIRNVDKLDGKRIPFDEFLEAEVTKPFTLKNCCADIDIVISTVGITRQKDNLTYMDVDYQANINLLNEAKRSNVKKFIYVSVLNGDTLENLKICEAKEKFVNTLVNSGLDYCIIRPNGFFSDMIEFYKMAKKGRVYLLGDGNKKANPIHGEDLAKVCVDAIEKHEKETEVGGPEILTQRDVADIAFCVSGNKKTITYIPEWLIKIILKLMRRFTKSQVYGPVEFFLTVACMDMVAPKNGSHTLKEYFESNKNI